MYYISRTITAIAIIEALPKKTYRLVKPNDVEFESNTETNIN